MLLRTNRGPTEGKSVPPSAEETHLLPPPKESSETVVFLRTAHLFPEFVFLEFWRSRQSDESLTPPEALESRRIYLGKCNAVPRVLPEWSPKVDRKAFRKTADRELKTLAVEYQSFYGRWRPQVWSYEKRLTSVLRCAGRWRCRARRGLRFADKS